MTTDKLSVEDLMKPRYNIIMYDIDCFIPATKTEFQEYINQNK